MAQQQMRAAGLPYNRDFIPGMPQMNPPNGPTAQAQAPALPALPLREQQQQRLQRQLAVQAMPPAERVRQLDPIVKEFGDGIDAGDMTSQMLARARASGAQQQAELVARLEGRIERMEMVIRGMASELTKSESVRAELEAGLTRLMTAKQNSDARQAALAGELIALSKEVQTSRAEASAAGRELSVAVARVEGKVDTDARLVEQLQKADADTVNSAAKQFVDLRASLGEVEAGRRRDQHAVEAALLRMEERARTLEAKAVERAASIAEARIGSLSKQLTQLEERQVAREVGLAERLREEVGVFRKHEATDKKVAIERLIVMESAIKEEHENRMRSQATLKKGIEAVAGQCNDSVRRLRADTDQRNKKLAGQVKVALEKMHGLMREAELGLKQERKALESVLKMEISARLKAMDGLRDEMLLTSRRSQATCASQVKHVAAGTSLLSEKVKLLLAAQRKLFLRQGTTEHNLQRLREEFEEEIVDSVLDKEVAGIVDDDLLGGLDALGVGVETSFRRIDEEKLRAREEMAGARTAVNAKIDALSRRTEDIRDALDFEEEERRQSYGVAMGVIESMDVRLMTAIQQGSSDSAKALATESERRAKDVEITRKRVEDEARARDDTCGLLLNRIRAESDARATAILDVSKDVSALNQKVDSAAADTTLFEEILRTEIDAVGRSGAAALRAAEARVAGKLKELSFDLREAIEQQAEESDQRVRLAAETEVEGRRAAINAVRGQIETIRKMAAEAVKLSEIASDATMQEGEQRAALELELREIGASINGEIAELRGTIARNLLYGERQLQKTAEHMRMEARQGKASMERSMEDQLQRIAERVDQVDVATKLDVEVLRADVMDAVDVSVDASAASMTREMDSLGGRLMRRIDVCNANGAAELKRVEGSLTGKMEDATRASEAAHKNLSEDVTATISTLEAKLETAEVAAKVDLEVMRTDLTAAVDSVSAATNASALETESKVLGACAKLETEILDMKDRIEESQGAHIAACGALEVKIGDGARHTAEAAEALRAELERQILDSLKHADVEHARLEERFDSEMRGLMATFDESAVTSKLDLEVLRADVMTSIDTAAETARTAASDGVAGLQRVVQDGLLRADERMEALRVESSTQCADVSACMTEGIERLETALGASIAKEGEGARAHADERVRALRADMDEGLASASRVMSKSDEKAEERYGQLGEEIEAMRTDVDASIDEMTGRLGEEIKRRGDELNDLFESHSSHLSGEVRRVDCRLDGLTDALEESAVHAKLDLEVLRTHVEDALGSSEGRLQEAVGESGRDLEVKLAGVDERAMAATRALRADLDASLDETRTRMDQEEMRLNQTDARLNQTNVRLNATNARVDQVDSRLDEMDTLLNETGDRVDAVRQDIGSDLERRVQASGRQHDALVKHVESVITRVDNDACASEAAAKLDLELLRTDLMHAVEASTTTSEANVTAAVDSMRVGMDDLGRSVMKRIDDDRAASAASVGRLEAHVDAVDARTAEESERLRTDVDGMIKEVTTKMGIELAERIELGEADFIKYKSDAEATDREDRQLTQERFEQLEAGLEDTKTEVIARIEQETGNLGAEITRLEDAVSLVESQTRARAVEESDRINEGMERLSALNAAVRDELKRDMKAERAEVDEQFSRQASEIESVVEACRETVEQSTVHAKVDLEVLRTDVMASLEAGAAAVSARMDSEMSEVRADVVDKARETRDTAGEHQASMEERLSRMEAETLAGIDGVRTSVMEVVEERATRLAEGIEGARTDFEGGLEKIESTVAQVESRLATDIDRAVQAQAQETTREITAVVTETSGKADAQLAALQEQLTTLVDAKHKDVLQKHAEARDDIEGVSARLDEGMASLRTAAAQVDEAFARQLEEHSTRVETSVRTEVADMKESMADMESGIDNRLREQQEQELSRFDAMQVSLDRIDAAVPQLEGRIREETDEMRAQVRRIDEDVAEVRAAAETAVTTMNASNVEMVEAVGARLSQFQVETSEKLEEQAKRADAHAETTSSRLDVVESSAAAGSTALHDAMWEAVAEAKRTMAEELSTAVQDVDLRLEEHRKRSEALQASADDRIDGMDASTSEALAAMREEIASTSEATSSRSDEQMADLRAHLGDAINSVEELMERKVGDVRTDLAAMESRAADTKAELEGGLGQLRTTLEADMTASLSGLRGDVDASVDALRKECTEATDTAKADVQALVRADIDERVGSLREQVDVRLEHADARVEHAQAKMERAENKFEHMENKFEHVENKFEHMENRFEEVNAHAEEVNREGLQVTLDRFDKLEAKMKSDSETVNADVVARLDARIETITAETKESIERLRRELEDGSQGSETRHAAYMAKFEAIESKAADDLSSVRSEWAAQLQESSEAAQRDESARLEALRAELREEIENASTSAKSASEAVEGVQAMQNELGKRVDSLGDGLTSGLDARLAESRAEIHDQIESLREEARSSMERANEHSTELQRSVEAIQEETVRLKDDVDRVRREIEASAASAAEEKGEGKENDSEASQKLGFDELVRDVTSVREEMDTLKAEVDKNVAAQQAMKVEIDATLQSTHEMIEDEASIRSVAMEELRNEELGHYKELMEHTTSRLAEEVDQIEESLNSHGDTVSGQQQTLEKLQTAVGEMEKALEAERAERTKTLAEENAERVDATQALEELIRSDASSSHQELKEDVERQLSTFKTQMKTEAAQHETKLVAIESRTLEDYSNMQNKIEAIEEQIDKIRPQQSDV